MILDKNEIQELYNFSSDHAALEIFVNSPESEVFLNGVKVNLSDGRALLTRLDSGKAIFLLN